MSAGRGAADDERYAGRLLDVGEILRAPDVPVPWRCEQLTADGYLTVLAGKGGEGKSWLSLALSCGVARGQTVAGIDCRKGRALLFDAENGPPLIARRLRAARVTADLAIQPVDAGGLHFEKDLDWFRATILRENANFVVFDSLRVLSSGVKENESDAMEPIITALRMLARETGTAILLIHHRGKGDSDYRGTSTILDQTDFLFTLTREQGDPEGRRRRKITTGKCRIEEEPMPRWLSIVADRHTGTVSINEAEAYGSGSDESPRPRDGLQEAVLEALGGIGQSGRGIADLLGEPEATVRRVLHDLKGDGLAEKTKDGWFSVRQPPTPCDAPRANCVNGDDAPETSMNTKDSTGASSASNGVTQGASGAPSPIGGDAPDAPPESDPDALSDDPCPAAAVEAAIEREREAGEGEPLPSPTAQNGEGTLHNAAAERLPPPGRRSPGSAPPAAEVPAEPLADPEDDQALFPAASAGRSDPAPANGTAATGDARLDDLIRKTLERHGGQ